MTQPAILLLLRVFVAMVTFLLSRFPSNDRGIFTEPLPSNDRGIHLQAHRLMGEIYEVCRLDGLRRHDIRTKFHTDWFSHSEVNIGNSQTHSMEIA